MTHDGFFPNKSNRYKNRNTTIPFEDRGGGGGRRNNNNCKLMYRRWGGGEGKTILHTDGVGNS